MSAATCMHFRACLGRLQSGMARAPDGHLPHTDGSGEGHCMASCASDIRRSCKARGSAHDLRGLSSRLPREVCSGRSTLIPLGGHSQQTTQMPVCVRETGHPSPAKPRSPGQSQCSLASNSNLLYYTPRCSRLQKASLEMASERRVGIAGSHSGDTLL